MSSFLSANAPIVRMTTGAIPRKESSETADVLVCTVGMHY